MTTHRYDNSKLTFSEDLAVLLLSTLRPVALSEEKLGRSRAENLLVCSINESLPLPTKQNSEVVVAAETAHNVYQTKALSHRRSSFPICGIGVANL